LVELSDSLTASAGGWPSGVAGRRDMALLMMYSVQGRSGPGDKAGHPDAANAVQQITAAPFRLFQACLMFFWSAA
jgi:hypothetical protein